MTSTYLLMVSAPIEKEVMGQLQGARVTRTFLVTLNTY